ncbi:hypothetical protein PAMA_020293 [Pampus argenteus]
MEKRERGAVSCQLNRALRRSFGGSCEDGRISLVPGVKIRAVGRASSENVSEWTADGSGSYTGCLGCAEQGRAFAPLSDLAPTLPSPSTGLFSEQTPCYVRSSFCLMAARERTRGDIAHDETAVMQIITVFPPSVDVKTLFWLLDRVL